MQGKLSNTALSKAILCSFQNAYEHTFVNLLTSYAMRAFIFRLFTKFPVIFNQFSDANKYSFASFLKSL